MHYTGLYNRLNLHVSADTKEVIKALRKRLNKKAKLNINRVPRHEIIREVLACHLEARQMFNDVQSGRFYQ